MCSAIAHSDESARAVGPCADVSSSRIHYSATPSISQTPMTDMGIAVPILAPAFTQPQHFTTHQQLWNPQQPPMLWHCPISIPSTVALAVTVEPIQHPFCLCTTHPARPVSPLACHRRCSRGADRPNQRINPVYPVIASISTSSHVPVRNSSRKGMKYKKATADKLAEHSSAQQWATYRSTQKLSNIAFSCTPISTSTPTRHQCLHS